MSDNLAYLMNLSTLKNLHLKNQLIDLVSAVKQIDLRQMDQNRIWISYAVAGLLALLCLFNIYQTLMFPHHLDNLFPPTPPIVAAPTTQTPLTVADMMNLQLFGIYQPPSALAPETRLHLILKGVFATNDPLQGSAIIISKDIGKNPNRDYTYVVGDKLPGGATITGVYPDYVELNNQGRLEKLPLPIRTIQ